MKATSIDGPHEKVGKFPMFAKKGPFTDNNFLEL